MQQRQEILKVIVNEFERYSKSLAFYEGGSVAFNREDQWSDLDLYLIVDDMNWVKSAFELLEKALDKIGGYDICHEVSWPRSACLNQRFYRLKKYSPYLLIDIAIMSKDAPDKYFYPEIHGDNYIFFDKKDLLKNENLDKDEFLSTMQKRKKIIEEKFNLFSPFITKELEREDYLYALDLYHNFILKNLIQVLRMRFSPFHYDFGFKSLKYDLPQDIVASLNELIFVRDEGDLRDKSKEAVDWFFKEIAQVG